MVTSRNLLYWIRNLNLKCLSLSFRLLLHSYEINRQLKRICYRINSCLQQKCLSCLRERVIEVWAPQWHTGCTEMSRVWYEVIKPNWGKALSSKLSTSFSLYTKTTTYSELFSLCVRSVHTFPKLKNVICESKSTKSFCIGHWQPYLSLLFLNLQKKMMIMLCCTIVGIVGFSYLYSFFS